MIYKISYKFILVCLAMALLSVGCKKEKIKSHINCQLPDGISTHFQESGKQFKLPSFNPINNEEFVFYLKDVSNGTRTLATFNLQTSEKTILVTGFDLITEPKWNTEGWIAFNNSQDYRLRVVQENGDSLQIFFDKSFSFAVTWLPNNNLYWRYSYTQEIGRAH